MRDACGLVHMRGLVHGVLGNHGWAWVKHGKMDFLRERERRALVKPNAVAAGPDAEGHN